MSSPCAPLPLRNVLHELIEQGIHSCDLVELRLQGSDKVTFRAASLLDDYMFRPQALGKLSLYEFVAAHFRRKRTQLTRDAALFLPDHPLFNTHCVGTHKCKVVPVVGGMHMPLVDTESPREIVVQRSQSALVLFKPFRVLTDLVTNPTNSDAWIEAFLQWHPTRTSFTCEIMANMDDYSRAAKESTERGETNATEVNTNDGDDSDEDDAMGTRDDIDAALDRAATTRESTVTPPVLSSDDFYHLFVDDDDGDGVGDLNEDQASVFPSNLPIFPNAASPVSNSQFQHLLRIPAQMTANTVDGSRRQASSTVEFSINELQQFVNDTSNDETERPRSESFRNEQPTEVIALLQSALGNAREWLPPPPPSPHDAPPPPPLKPYASIVEVSQTFTLNERQHIAFTLIATSLLMWWQCSRRICVVEPRRGTTPGLPPRTDRWKILWRFKLPSRKNSSRQTSSIVSKPPSDSVGKSGETRQEVSYLRCQTLGAAISHAQSYERAHFTGNNVSSDQAGRPAATATPEPMDISAMDSRRISKEACCQHRLCFYCKAPGHRIRDCSKKP
ncbi:hypothetical protein F442_03692 [Phytophthora nicotianae P10297]|uniref:CCHC-type domain-containing protein n=1 Tax=Phytophthora nicotianae P10297 TaxID=1317064 RepID=W2ZVQ0_PHYNI|nr:hypothetical protein F442_03692 [Phytophthora nicotianae P10297]